MEEKDLEQRIKSIQNIATENPNVDVGSLMMNMLEHQHEDNNVSDKDKTKGYLVSFFMPPAALYYFVKFFFGDKDDGRRIGTICLLIAILTTLLSLVGSKLMLNSSGIGSQNVSTLSSQLLSTFK